MAKNDKYSRRSIGYLNGCEPVLKPFMIRTLYYAPTDMSILKTTNRTIQQQREYFELGTSHTMDSMHLPGVNGLSRAVDAVPYIRGANPWNLPTFMYEDIHKAAQKAARELNLNIRSGVTWDNLNSDIDFDDQLWRYRERKRKQGKRPFFDGPHFELYRAEYP